MLRDLFLGFVKVHILHHAAIEPVYGLALIEELGRHGYTISPGTLYPLLHRMEEQGYLQREERLVVGKIRKYYAITEQGRHALAEAQHYIRELVTEVVDGEGPQHLPDPDAEDPDEPCA
jgi:PadR family transcriptional regulator, regulatory protein PadR